jgi:4-amino-4-deoxy-L-arabinose transferase-like glycosyltransferase
MDFFKNLKNNSVSDRKIILFLFSVTLLMRVLYAIAFYFTNPQPVTNAYYEIALKILDQGRIFYETGNPYYESAGPLLPWINALTMMVAGRNYLGLYLVTALVSSLITMYTYKLARIVFDKSISFFIGAWSAFYLFYFYFTPAPGKDMWMAFFMVFLLYKMVMLFRLKEFSYRDFFLFTLMFVFSFHLDERFFVFSPFIFLYILIYETEFFSRFRTGKALIFAGLILVLMVPWTIRNYNVHNKIVIISTRTEAFTDRLFGYEPGEHIMDNFTDIHGAYYISEDQTDSVIKGLKTTTDGGRRIAPEMVTAMRNGNLPRPLTGIKAAMSRLVTMFEPIQLKGRFERTGYFYYKKSWRHNIATFFFYGVLFIFSLPGFYFIYKKDRNAAALFISVIIIYGMIHALAIPYTNWRYRLPLDAIFIIAGCSGMAQTWSVIRKEKLQADKN